MSKISRDEMARRVGGQESASDELRVTSEEGQGSGGAGEQGGLETAAAETLPVTVTKWAGLVNYECGFCAFATLDAAVMAAHLRAVHWKEGISDQWPVVGEEVVALADRSSPGGEEMNQDEVK